MQHYHYSIDRKMTMVDPERRIYLLQLRPPSISPCLPRQHVAVQQPWQEDTSDIHGIHTITSSVYIVAKTTRTTFSVHCP